MNTQPKSTYVPNEYDLQAEDFCKEYGVTITSEKCVPQQPPLWAVEGKPHGIQYSVTMKRGTASYKFHFWNSIKHKEDLEKLARIKAGGSMGDGVKIGGKWVTSIHDPIYKKLQAETPLSPRAYDILACITKYDPGTFEDFCSEFGHDQDSRSARKTWKAVCKEWKNVSKLFPEPEVLEALSEIQ